MSIDGNYKLTLDTPIGAQEGRMTLKADGASLSGSLVNARGTTEFSGGTVNGTTSNSIPGFRRRSGV